LQSENAVVVRHISAALYLNKTQNQKALKMQREYPKAIKKEMRRIAGIAYQRELDKALRELQMQFKK
jgi:hypothetical protein